MFLFVDWIDPRCACTSDKQYKTARGKDMWDGLGLRQSNHSPQIWKLRGGCVVGRKSTSIVVHCGALCVVHCVWYIVVHFFVVHCLLHMCFELHQNVTDRKIRTDTTNVLPLQARCYRRAKYQYAVAMNSIVLHYSYSKKCSLWSFVGRCVGVTMCWWCVLILLFFFLFLLLLLTMVVEHCIQQREVIENLDPYRLPIGLDLSTGLIELAPSR